MKHQSEGLLNQITDLKQRHEIELIEMQAKTREFQEKKIEEREIMHKEEVAALTQEWHVERKVSGGELTFIFVCVVFVFLCVLKVVL